MLQRPSYTDLKAQGPRYSDRWGKRVAEAVPAPAEKTPGPNNKTYRPNDIYAKMVNDILADPSADPLVRSAFREYFAPSFPLEIEPKVQCDMMALPANDSGLNHLHFYSTEGLQHMVRKLGNEIRQKPQHLIRQEEDRRNVDRLVAVAFPEQSPVESALEDLRIMHQTPSRYSFGAIESFSHSKLQSELSAIAADYR